MVELALCLGIFSLVVFGLGLLGITKHLLLVLGLLFIVILFWVIKNNLPLFLKEIIVEIKKDKIVKAVFFLLIFQSMVNLVGALGPELGFDALWYHLTIPKIYLNFKGVFFIPGGLYYYSAMPKLTEMLYLVSLSFSESGTLAKLIHFSFGILSSAVLYNLAKKYLKPRYVALTTLLFYSTLIVGWQSITAYVDLTRTFFELLALERFLSWKGKKEEFVESAMMLGLAVSVKLIALASLPVFLVLVFLKSKRIRYPIYYLLITLLTVSPWLIFSYLNTGNPVYPLFESILDPSHTIIIPTFLRIVADIWQLLYKPADPISPIFSGFIPLVFWTIFHQKGKFPSEIKYLGWYSLLSLGFWYLTPRTGGSRFILPYLPAFSLLMVWVLTNTYIYWRKIFIYSVIMVSSINLGYRALANYKFIPVLFRQQSRDIFLSKHLNFNNGDFYDPGKNISKIIHKDDLVLVYGSHNLFYADFPFIHESFVSPDTKFSYVLTQNTNLVEKLANLAPIYENNKTGTRLYLFGNSLNEY